MIDQLMMVVVLATFDFSNIHQLDISDTTSAKVLLAAQYDVHSKALHSLMFSMEQRLLVKHSTPNVLEQLLKVKTLQRLHSQNITLHHPPQTPYAVSSSPALPTPHSLPPR